MTLQEKRTSMFELVETWKQSGLTQIEFARDHNLTLSKFRYWVHKSRALGADDASSGFVRLSGNGFSLNGTTGEIRLHYPNGVWLSLPGNTPVPVLKTLVDF